MTISAPAEVYGTTGSSNAVESPGYVDRTRTVSTNATGFGDGSPSNPWTLQQAMERAVSGDIVGIEAGVYVGTQPDYGDDIATLRMRPAFVPRHDGTEAAPIVFVAQYPAALHDTQSQYTDIRSGAPLDSWEYDDDLKRDARRGWPAFGASYWSGGDWTQWIGIYSNEGAENNRIYEDCGVCTIRGVDNFLVKHCKLIGAGTNDSGAGAGGNNYSAIRIEDTVNPVIADNYISRFGVGFTNCQGITFYFTENHLIEHNYIEHVSEGLHFKGGTAEQKLWGTVRFNHYYRCVQAYKFSGPTYSPAGDRNPFYQELIEDCDHWYQFTTGGGTVYHEGLDFYNCTIVNSGGYGSTDPGTSFFQAIAGSYDGLGVYRNNILYNLNRYLGIGYSTTNGAQKVSNWGTYDYNCLYNTQTFVAMGGIDLAGWRGTYGQDVNSITVDPQFVDVAASDYRLKSGSPCEGTGLGGINMGCYINGDEVIGVRD